MRKTILQATGTLIGVLSLYLAPWGLTIAQYQAPTFEVLTLPSAQREAVVWHPYVPDEDAAVEAPADDLTLELPTKAHETKAHETKAHETKAQVPNPTTSKATPTPRRVRPSKRKLRPRPKRPSIVAKGKPVRKTRVLKRPARTLTKKQKRQRARWKKRQNRLAEQPQCSDWIDQMVKIDSTETTDEWLIGQDLVSCFRAHPQQFMNMGGMSWAEENGKRIGLRIYVSSKPRGDVARAIGFHRGDVLRSFNGFSLRSVTTVTFALTQLTRNKAKLKYVRKGQKRVFKLKVVDHEELEAARLEQLALVEADGSKPR